jgi:hypothetical protein
VFWCLCGENLSEQILLKEKSVVIRFIRSITIFFPESGKFDFKDTKAYVKLALFIINRKAKMSRRLIVFRLYQAGFIVRENLCPTFFNGG